MICRCERGAEKPWSALSGDDVAEPSSPSLWELTLARKLEFVASLFVAGAHRFLRLAATTDTDKRFCSNPCYAFNVKRLPSEISCCTPQVSAIMLQWSTAYQQAPQIPETNVQIASAFPPSAFSCIPHEHLSLQILSLRFFSLYPVIPFQRLDFFKPSSWLLQAPQLARCTNFVFCMSEAASSMRRAHHTQSNHETSEKHFMRYFSTIYFQRMLHFGNPQGPLSSFLGSSVCICC